MQEFSNYIIPVIIVGIFLWGLIQKKNVFELFLEGATDGLKTSVSIVPALICLLTAVTMFKTSGAMTVLMWIVRPFTELIGLPSEVLPMALMRPISGSGAMVLFSEILAEYGPDSFVGKVASVLEGSSETTFYTIAVYYGATKVKDTRHTLVSSLAGDFTTMIFSVITVSLLLT